MPGAWKVQNYQYTITKGTSEMNVTYEGPPIIVSPVRDEKSVITNLNFTSMTRANIIFSGKN